MHLCPDEINAFMSLVGPAMTTFGNGLQYVWYFAKSKVKFWYKSYKTKLDKSK